MTKANNQKDSLVVPGKYLRTLTPDELKDGIKFDMVMHPNGVVVKLPHKTKADK